MGQRHCYQLKVVSTWILYFMIESIILNFILLVAETNNLSGIVYIYNLNKCEFIKKSICIIQLKFWLLYLK